MHELTHNRRTLQAEAYFALATIIQGLMLTAVGNEMVIVLRTIALPELLWSLVTGLLSLLLSFTFWYIFIRDFFFGFRVFELNAANHFFLAAAIFAAGFLQFIAFQFLADPRLWLTLVLMSIGVVFFNSWYVAHKIPILEREEVRAAIHYSPNQTLFSLLLLATLVSLTAWYAFAALDTPWWRGFTLLVMAAALVTLNLNSVKVFQKHLDVDRALHREHSVEGIGARKGLDRERRERDR